MLEKEEEDRLNKIELLERNFESEKQKLREQVLIARETANIAQFDSYFGEVIPDEAKSSTYNARHVSLILFHPSISKLTESLKRLLLSSSD